MNFRQLILWVARVELTTPIEDRRYVGTGDFDYRPTIAALHESAPGPSLQL
jgi:hypothetical protein